MRGLDPPAGPEPFGAAKARASIPLHKNLSKKMDGRVKPYRIHTSPTGSLAAHLIL
jgi:hypothetical protein